MNLSIFSAYLCTTEGTATCIHGKVGVPNCSAHFAMQSALQVTICCHDDKTEILYSFMMSLPHRVPQIEVLQNSIMRNFDFLK